MSSRDAHRERSASQTPWWQRIVAFLTFDSRAQPAPPGNRGAAPASFHLLFEAGDTDIDLLCEREEGDWRITGQALSANPPETGWTISAAGPAGQATTETDAQGEFRLSGLPASAYQLTLRGPSREIVLPDVRLEEPLPERLV